MEDDIDALTAKFLLEMTRESVDSGTARHIQIPRSACGLEALKELERLAKNLSSLETYGDAVRQAYISEILGISEQGCTTALVREIRRNENFPSFSQFGYDIDACEEIWTRIVVDLSRDEMQLKYLSETEDPIHTRISKPDLSAVDEDGFVAGDIIDKEFSLALLTAGVERDDAMSFVATSITKENELALADLTDYTRRELGNAVTDMFLDTVQKMALSYRDDVVRGKNWVQRSIRAVTRAIPRKAMSVAVHLYAGGASANRRDKLGNFFEGILDKKLAIATYTMGTVPIYLAAAYKCLDMIGWVKDSFTWTATTSAPIVSGLLYRFSGAGNVNNARIAPTFIIAEVLSGRFIDYLPDLPRGNTRVTDCPWDVLGGRIIAYRRNQKLPGRRSRIKMLP